MTNELLMSVDDSTLSIHRWIHGDVELPYISAGVDVLIIVSRAPPNCTRPFYDSMGS